MLNIKLCYMYRDYANYKNYGEAIFTNPDMFSLEQIEVTLRTYLLDEEYFYASRWGVKDLHFDKFDDEIDHAFHEYLGVELTQVESTEQLTITGLLERIIYSEQGGYENGLYRP